MRQILRKFFSIFNLGLVKSKDLELLHQIFVDFTCLTNKLNFFLFCKKNSELLNLEKFMTSNLLINSKSQNGQDFFALVANRFKTDGVFVEFGAYDGVTFSNSYLLEQQFNWTGLLIDPIPRHFEKMKLYRKCKLVQGAVTPTHETSILVEELPASDLSKSTTKKSIFKKYHKVKAYTFDNVIEENLDSKIIDFLSIDIEGNELAVLKTINFSQYIIRAICIEHNFGPNSNEILDYLNLNGYKQVFRSHSKNDFWFVLNSDIHSWYLE